jgi:hypothetical protein
MFITNPNRGKKDKKRFFKVAIFSALLTPLFFIFSARQAHAWSLFGAATGITDFLGSAMGWIVFAISYIISLIISLLIVVITYLIGVILQLNGQVVNSLAVQSGFTITLAVANMGFVLGIIVIAIMTIIRSQTYGMKQLLWKFIAAAILVNFSLVIGGVIINFANLFTNYFMAALPGGGGGASAGFFGFANAISGAFTTTGHFGSDAAANIGAVNGSASLNDSSSLLGGSIASIITPIFGLIFTVIMLALILITLGTFLFMLCVRYIELSILLILMPLVWLFWVFPKLSHLWDKWWNEFLRWTFFAPIVMFFVYLSIATAHTMTAANSSSGWTALAPGLSANGYISPSDGVTGSISSFIGGFINTTVGQALQMLVVIGLMVGGMVAADKLSIMGAGAAMNSMKGKSGVGEWMKNRAQAGRAAGWRNRGKIAGAIRHPKQALKGVGGFKGAAGSTWNGVKGAPGWVASRLAAKTQLAVHPYLTNKKEVEDANKRVPESVAEIKDNLEKKNLSESDVFAHLGELMKRGKLEETQMVRGQLASDWKDKHKGSVDTYAWGKESDEANVFFGGDEAVRKAAEELKKIPESLRGTSAAMANLNTAVDAFGAKLSKSDMSAMGKGGSLVNGSDSTKALFRFFMDKAPRLAASAISGMKGTKPREYVTAYTNEIDSETEKARAVGNLDRVKYLDHDEKGEPLGIKQRILRSAGRDIEGLTPGVEGGRGGTPSPEP